MSKVIKRFPINCGLILVFFFVFINEGLGDEIILKNGDRLSGTITKLEKGILTITTEYSEPIKVKKEKIESINTDRPIEIHMLSGEILKGQLETSKDGRIIVESSVERETTAINWGKVIAVNPSPVIPPKWKGNIVLGADLQSGNTKRSSASIGAEASRRTARDRFSLRFLHNYAEESDQIIARNTYGALKYDYFFKKSLYGYLGIELLNDKFKDLNLRTTVGPGVGYQIWDDLIKLLSFEVGMSYVSEDLKKGEDKHWITGRLAGNFSYKIKDTIVLADQLILYPSLEDVGQYQLRNEAAVTSALSTKWALKFTNILERDSNPPEDIKKNDLYWILGLQYSF